MKLTRIPISFAQFAQPVVLHPKYGSRLSIFHGQQKDQKNYKAEICLIVDLGMIETKVYDSARDNPGDVEVRYVNVANTIIFQALHGVIELDQSTKKRGDNAGQKAEKKVDRSSGS